MPPYFLQACRRSCGRRPSLARLSRPKAQTGRKIARANEMGSPQGTGSAHNSWFSLPVTPKLLILVRSGATSCTAFATSLAAFAISPVWGRRCAQPSFSLSKLLKEKKKEGWKAKTFSDTCAPRVDLNLPSVRGVACFLGHEFHESRRPDPWQLRAHLLFKISDLPALHRSSTSPRVALRVVQLSARAW
jgi:hypothetical protein